MSKFEVYNEYRVILENIRKIVDLENLPEITGSDYSSSYNTGLICIRYQKIKVKEGTIPSDVEAFWMKSFSMAILKKYQELEDIALEIAINTVEEMKQAAKQEAIYILAEVDKTEDPPQKVDEILNRFHNLEG